MYLYVFVRVDVNIIVLCSVHQPYPAGEQSAAETIKLRSFQNQTYAERYIRMREEYETHVKRLLTKLTNEQQARCVHSTVLELCARVAIVFTYLVSPPPSHSLLSLSSLSLSFLSLLSLSSLYQKTSLSFYRIIQHLICGHYYH